MVLLLLWGPVSRAAAAEFGIAPGGFAVRMLDAEGNPENRSGSHPDRFQIDFALETEGTGTSARDLAVEMPPGFGGNPAAVPACSRQAHEEGEECPSSSQVGIVSFGSSEPLPIFLLEPEPGQVTSFTSKTGLPIPFQLQLRPGDFGITFVAEDLAEGAPSEAQIELWGVPADHQEAPTAEPRPFLTAPTVCGPLSFTLRTRSREENAPWLSADAEAGPLTGCEDLAFAPRLGLQLSNPIADSPTGLRMALSMPAEEAGSELASAQMKDVAVELPPGLTVSPGGAAGLMLCSDAQLGLGSEAPATCPAASRVGTAELDSAALSGPLTGAVYLGQQRGGERFRLFIVAPGPGIVFKFVTSLQPDPATGQLTATLHDLPQVAIGQIAINLDGGSGGLLAAPLGCGPTQGRAGFTAYGGAPPVVSTAAVAIGSALPGLACPGPLPFSPQLLVSASSHRAGRASSFAANLHRRSGEGLPAQFSLTLPAGLSAALGSVEACPEALAGSGSCPAASRVGSTRAAVGSGPNPAVLDGAAYVAGPYRRAPFSLVMAFQAAVGPFELGRVAFRAAARIDGRTGRVSVATDRLPSVVGGVPIRFEAIAISLDRAGLVRNPTSCGPHSLDAALESQEGAVAALSTPYRVHGCKRLGFAPRLRAVLADRGRLHRHARVAMKVAARFRRADAALRSLSLSLPPALKLGIGGLREICSRPDARRGLCPAGSKVGTSRARTPLLDEPLAGSVYVVRPRGDGEPDLWVALAGGGVKLAIHGTSKAVDGRFVSRLAGLPDLPLTDFVMRLGVPGGGLLSLDANPCAAGQADRFAADILATGQNGRRHRSSLDLAAGAHCGSGTR